ncbi:MAG: PD40 domain-containing protein, partial [Thermoguttaceae bacterium]|nr:PD40 domain-containing protein [Thermoguttaceae bacterium]
MTFKLFQSALLTVAATFFAATAANVRAAETQTAPEAPPKVVVEIDGVVRQPSFGTVAGSWFYNAGPDGSQLLLLGFPKGGVEQAPNYRLIADLNSESVVRLTIPVDSPRNVASASCSFKQLGSVPAFPNWSRDDEEVGPAPADMPPGTQLLSVFPPSDGALVLTIQAPKFDAASSGATSGAIGVEKKTCAIEISNFQTTTRPIEAPLSLEPTRKPQSLDPIATSPDFRPTLANAAVNWDWRLQDGIGTEREPRTFLQALEKQLPQGRALLDDLAASIDDGTFDNLSAYDPKIGEKIDAFAPRLDAWNAAWADFEKRFNEIKIKAAQESADAATVAKLNRDAESLWREVRTLKRQMLVESPLFQFGSLLFVKHAPSVMSHQLTQVYGYCARPGGGLFVLDEPGRSMKTRDVTPQNLPLGSFMTPELSFDGKTLYFAYCETPSTPKIWRDPETMERRFHLYKTSLNDVLDGKSVDATRLTDGPYDDFSPLLLPDGDLIFCSTRRGGFHRCGAGPCYVYTLTRSRGDGSDPRPISFHETNEWNPTLMSDGRVVYTRWDYVDRDAVYYQNLWSARQDGTDVRIHYGNNTFNPCGLWESKAIPGSSKTLAIAGPHHGMSAGTVVTLDVNRGVDGPEPLERLTPEVRFPEGEAPLPNIPQLPHLSDFDYVPTGFWQATREAERAEQTVEERRWPVHTFKSPFPLSEKYFVASYSYDKLLGEAGPNIPNQYGVYFCDAFGNRELVYRDPNISSVWALPIRPRPVPPVSASALDETERDAESPTGTFFMQNVYESWPTKLPSKIKSLRIVQVLPKTTPNANQPTVGVANASPGKQVLGTVPVEEDGSAHFEAPACKPLLFQALDENGRMVQGMRSLVYLQPGESAGCVGCHEDRTAAVPSAKTIASTKQPAQIEPGPDGSKPFSFPILVQPILDKKCVACHNAEKAEGGVDLTSTPEGAYTKSYNALVKFVPYSAWGNPDGNFEPITEPDRFGSRPSRLTKLLEDGHYDVKLDAADWERLNTWQDVNALFYGTFN